MFKDGLFGFESDGDFSEIGKGWEVFLAAFFDEVCVESGVIVVDGVLDNGMVGLESLNYSFGFLEVATADAAEDLGDKFEGALFGGKIRKSESRIGLDDADGGEFG